MLGLYHEARNEGACPHRLGAAEHEQHDGNDRRHVSVDTTELTDSEYLQRGMTQLVAKWEVNGWRASSGKPVLNRELWIELESAAAPQEVRRTWIPGHGPEEPDHNRADSLARQAAMAGAA